MKRKKLIALTASFFIWNTFAYAASGIDFKTPVPPSEISAFKSFYTTGDARNPLASHLLEKNFALNEYELVIIGEDLRNELKKKRSENLPAVGELMAKHLGAYELVSNSPLLSSQVVAEADAPAQRPQQQQQQSPFDLESILQRMQPSATQIPVSTATYEEAAAAAATPEQQREAFSMLNINPAGTSVTPAAQDTSVTPQMEYDGSGDAMKAVPAPPEPRDTDAEIRELVSIANDDILDREAKKAKDFYVYAIHSLDYVKEHGTGNVPLRTDVVNDEGQYYQPSVTEQYQLEHVLELGFGTKISDAVDILVGVEVKNEDGLLFAPGTTWGFSNLHLVPRMKRLQNKTGISIQNGGEQVGVDIGHGTRIVSDTTNGDIGLAAKGKSGSFFASREGGFSAKDMTGRYYFSIGKLSLDFSTYTLKLSDCDAVQVGYKDDNQSFVFLVGRPQKKSEGYTENGITYKGKYDRILYGAQYVIQNAIPNMSLAFNFARANDKGDLSNPNGALKGTTTVYSLAFNSEGMRNTSIQGEIARSVNNVAGETITGNADFLDVSHRFSDRLSGTLHAVNIDPTFNAESLVEDKTGDFLYTTNQGDGRADYLYQEGQRGLDFTLQYRFPENAGLAFGYSRYSLTTDGNSKTNFYLAGNKSWTVTDDDGNTRAQLGIQQRFEYANVSTEDFTQRASTTTASLSAEPWKNAELETNYQYIVDNAEGNERRFDISLAQNIYPLDRVKITPKIEYQSKKGDEGLRHPGEGGIDSSTLITSLAVGYELVPDELTVNLLVSKEKYDVITSEIDRTTGKKVDGEKRDITGVGIGLEWEPKKIPGLTAAVSYRKDRVQYYSPEPDLSHQNVWEYSLEYSRPVGKMWKAGISYNYRSAKDKAKPIYDEVTQDVGVSIDATLGENSTLRLEHHYESEYKPLDPAANYTTQTTIARVYNSF